MTHKQLILELTKREAGKTQVSVAQIREIVGHLADIFTEHNDCRPGMIPSILLSVGEKRAKKKARKK